MRLRDWHIACRLGLYAVGIQLALSQMVVLLNTLIILRPILGGALPPSVFWDAYLGAMPNVFYLVLALSTAFALALGYIHYARDRMFVALFAAHQSHWRLAAPGLAVAAAAVLAGTVVANVLAPRGADRLEDAKHLVRAELPHRLLPEKRFVDLVPSRLTIYFREWSAPDVVSQITIFDRRNDAEHRVIDAKAARFVRDGRSLSIVLGAGSLHAFDVASGRTRRVEFGTFTLEHPLDFDPELARRPRPLFYVQSTGWLFSPPAEIRADESWYRRSQAELHKRLATPAFAICYALIVIGLVLLTDRTGRGGSALLFVLPVALSCTHVALIVLFETGVRAGAGMVVFGYVTLAALAAGGALLIEWQQSNFSPAFAARVNALLRRRAAAPSYDDR
jgi:lipopolysaccharide export LptBFGC system permease protein LptF